MKISRIPLYLLIAGTLAATGCSQDGHTAHVQNTQDGHHRLQQQMKTLRNPDVIPSIDRMKVKTTNEYGGTSYGMGTSVYSRIGSSGLQSEGLSKHLESRLAGMGIHGVSVFVFDDTVVLAAAKRESTASQYDPMQKKVLSGTAGFSGKGPEPGSRVGTYGAGNATDVNIDMAAKQMETLIGGSVHVIRIVNPEAVKIINQIRSYSDAPEAHPSQIADGLNKLLRLSTQKQAK